MLSPLYGECHTSGKRLQPVTKISLCQISVGKSVCNGFPDRLGFRTSLEITFWAIPKQSHSRVSPSTLTTKRSSPLLSAYAPFSRLGDKFLHCLFLRRVLHLFPINANDGTAAGINDLRRLKVKRCGELALRLSLRLTFANVCVAVRAIHLTVNMPLQIRVGVQRVFPLTQFSTQI